MTEDSGSATSPITIKKYANRRLYNTATSSYVTLDHLCQMVKDGQDFVVYDAKTGEDITRTVLTQIIVEEEQKSGHNLLPIGFLRQLIGFYGDNLQWLVPRYLEASMQTFSRNQDQFRSYMQGAFGNFFPFGRIEEMGKQNLAMLERAMQMWTPFTGAAAGKPPEPPADEASGGRPPETIRDLQARVDALQKQLEALSSRDGGKGGR
ncbi:MAG: polyhydroxyalkanoate synthesis repressor PhaR [Alphaproteobacteria bacterium]|nr:polyhydroxyalkanoate synthesis repressor PhaR [Alphaproteobacteria bacterium]